MASARPTWALSTARVTCRVWMSKTKSRKPPTPGPRYKVAAGNRAVVSRSISPPRGSNRFCLAPRTYGAPPWGVRVVPDRQTKSRKIANPKNVTAGHAPSRHAGTPLTRLYEHMICSGLAVTHMAKGGLYVSARSLGDTLQVGIRHAAASTRSAHGQRMVSAWSARGQHGVSMQSAHSRHAVSTRLRSAHCRHEPWHQTGGTRSARGQHTVSTRSARTLGPSGWRAVGMWSAHGQHTVSSLSARTLASNEWRVNPSEFSSEYLVASRSTGSKRR